MFPFCSRFIVNNFVGFHSKSKVGNKLKFSFKEITIQFTFHVKLKTLQNKKKEKLEKSSNIEKLQKLTFVSKLMTFLDSFLIIDFRLTKKLVNIDLGIWTTWIVVYLRNVHFFSQVYSNLISVIFRSNCKTKKCENLLISLLISLFVACFYIDFHRNEPFYRFTVRLDLNLMWKLEGFLDEV